MATPKPKPTISESQRREEVLKQNQKRISPEGVAAADAAAMKALEQKYPGMFLPKTRTTAGMYRSK